MNKHKKSERKWSRRETSYYKAPKSDSDTQGVVEETHPPKYDLTFFINGKKGKESGTTKATYLLY